MLKILVAIPLEENLQEYKHVIHQLPHKDIEVDIRQIIGTDEVVIRTCEADIVIARGITALAIKEMFPEICIVEIEVTGYDVFKAINVAKKRFQAQRIGLIASESLLNNVESLQELMDVSILTYPIRVEGDVEKALDQGLVDGVQCFIGGRTTGKHCNNRNINYISLLVGEEAILRSAREAFNAARSLNQEKAKIALMKQVLNSSVSGMVAINTEGFITEINEAAASLFHITSTSMGLGKSIDKFLADFDWKTVIKKKEEVEELKRIRNRLHVINCVPILGDGNASGVLFTIQNAEKIRIAESKIRTELRSKGLVGRYVFENIVGNSKQIRQNIKDALKYSTVDSNVLIVGETGTGKELFAHSIHNASKRREQPFVAINCAALPENLLESELFGYVEGAFSGAMKGGKVGLFELAHNGTIFLDEIGELPYALQAKLLRVLQEREIRRVGDNRIIPINVRIISATNVDIMRKIKQREFRSDLYYRLNLLELSLYPLRERIDDIPILCQKFITQYSKEYDRKIILINDDAMEELKSYTWPGNIRELRNVCERLSVLNESREIGSKDVLFLRKRVADEDEQQHDQQHEQMIELMMEMGMKKNQIAETFGMSRSTLWRKLKKNGPEA